MNNEEAASNQLKITKLSPKPGEIVLIEVSAPITKNDARRLLEEAKRVMPAGVRAMILPTGMRAFIRPAPQYCEPWEVGEATTDGGRSFAGIVVNGKQAIRCQSAIPFHDKLSGGALADRIIACVNYCEGIDNESLADGCANQSDIADAIEIEEHC